MSSKLPKPFFRTARNAWIVQIAGKRIPLGPDRDAAFRRYHGIVAQPRPVSSPVTAGTVLATLERTHSSSRSTETSVPSVSERKSDAAIVVLSNASNPAQPQWFF